MTHGDKALHDMYRFKHNYAKCPDCEMDLTDRVKPTCAFGVHDGRFIPSNVLENVEVEW